ncbi:MAG: T9SS type A sorting domain-containing protein [Saprospiraceae bacterium]
MDSILDQNVWRTFIVHLPFNYNTNKQYPIVLNLHGYNSNATQQQLYTQFDKVADTEGFIVVYPNAISNSWDLNGNNDVNFISHLVDALRSNYSCNLCLFITGLSDGGFMTYKLACTLQKPINAIAIGSGNMTKFLQNSCTSAAEIPLMHFHGTADQLVAYNGVSPFIPPVDTTIKWWISHNNCNLKPEISIIPDINITDHCNVEKYFYDGGNNGSELTLYKVIDGGHTWSGTFPVPGLGNTNQDINQSSIIGSFFRKFCSSSNSVSTTTLDNIVLVYPNPFQDNIIISNFSMEKSIIVIYDCLTKEVIKREIFKSTTLNTEHLQAGIYFYKILQKNKIICKGKIIKQ